MKNALTITFDRAFVYYKDEGPIHAKKVHYEQELVIHWYAKRMQSFKLAMVIQILTQ